MAKNKHNQIDIKLIVIIAVSALALASVIFAIIFISGMGSGGDPVETSVRIEAGEKLDISDFLQNKSASAKFPEGFDITEYTSKVGTHSIPVIVDGKEYKVPLIVKDSIAPKATVRKLFAAMGGDLSAADMVTDVTDATNVSVSFDRSPNMYVTGKQNVSIKLTDEGGNTTVLSSFVYVLNTLNVPEWELGNTFPTVTDFTTDGINITYEDTGTLFSQIKEPGKYYVPLRIKIGSSFESYLAAMNAKDTTPPVAIPKTDCVHDVNEELPTADKWFSELSDATKFTVSYDSEYLIKNPGTYTLSITVKDIAGNETKVTVTLTAIDTKVDNGGPVISIQSPVKVTVGNDIDFSKFITITDDKDGSIDVNDTEKVKIDTLSFNKNLPGEYTFLISAKDNSGKTSNMSFKVLVIHEELTEAEIDAELDKLLSSITTPGMTFEAKLQAIFNYVNQIEGINAEGMSDKQNTVKREAYYAIKRGYGDSYTSACTVSALVSRLGNDAQIVKNIKGTHYWALVDFGDAWFHVDAYKHIEEWKAEDETVRQTLKLTDSEMKEFTDWYELLHRGSDYYNFNQSLYPRTPVINEETGEYIYKNYTAFYIVGEGGYLDGVADQEIEHGGKTTEVTAVAKAGYKFIGWSDGITSATRSDIIKNDLTVTALFEEDSSSLIKTYKIQYIALPGGKIIGETIQHIKSGYTTTKVTAVPDEGYVFAGWNDGNTDPERSDIARRELTFTASFVLSTGNSYTNEYTAAEGGKIEGEATQTRPEGLSFETVTAVPGRGYIFLMWSDGIFTPERTDSAEGSNKTIEALFAPVGSSVISVSYKAENGGSIEGAGLQRIVLGSSTFEVTAVAAEGYRFVAWSDGVTEATRSDIPEADGMTYTAIFEAIEQIRVIYLIRGEGGYIDGATTQNIFKGQTTTQVIAIANRGYRFKEWSDGVTTPERSDTPDANMEVTAIFEAVDQFTVTYTAGLGGAITGSTSQTLFIGETTSSVTAVPDKGFKFVSWSDGVTDATRSDIVRDNTEITAIFEELPDVTISYYATTGGTVSGSAVQTVKPGFSTETVTAVANEGYKFVSWSDGLTTAERSDMAGEENKNFFAMFEKITEPQDPADPTDPTDPTDPAVPAEPVES